MKVFLWALFIIALVVAGPILTIWAVMHWKDVLVNDADPYTWQTWVSVIILGAFVRSNIKVSK